MLLAHIINQSRPWVLAHLEYELSTTEYDNLLNAITKVENGVPLPYILGYWEFFGRKFFLTSDVLIPRPETELMVEKALQWIENRHNNQKDKILAADIGCGCGCIGISLAIDHPLLNVLATDISFDALKVAYKNSIFHSVSSNFHPIQCNLLPPTSEKFDLICANLPYIPTQTLVQLKVYQKEPTLALDGGEEGLNVIHNLLSIAPINLTPGGLLLLEIESSQGVSAIQIAKNNFPDANVELYKDLAGHDRLISIQQGN